MEPDSELNKQTGQKQQKDPRWPVVLTTLSVLALYRALPEPLTLGPSWAVIAVALLLLIPSIIAHQTGRAELNRILATSMLAVISFAEVWSLIVLLAGIPAKRQTAGELLRSAVALWVSNILICACWYWRLDAGGPHRRASRHAHTEGAFLFPQMVLPDKLKGLALHWKPGFVDYLFLAFNTSTAFSPTDSPVLSRWAKLVSMFQSTVSLVTIAVLAARAINIF